VAVGFILSSGAAPRADATVRLALSILIALAGSTLAAASAQQTAVPVEPPVSAHSRLIGSWKIDRRQLPDDQDVWRRRVDAMPTETAAPRAGAFGASDPMLASPGSSYSALDIATLRSAMRDLLETAERLSFGLGDDAVTITDDLNRALTFATTGKKERRQLAATEFDAKTKWSGEALTQDVTVWNFAMTEVYLPKQDNEELLVSIRIVKPNFQPPIKDISRVYTRIK